MRQHHRTSASAPPPRGQRGFTLVEALVALVIVSLAFLLVVGLLYQEPAILARARARTEALAAMEGTMEGIRAGVIPLEDASLDVAAVPGAAREARHLVLWIDVESDPEVEDLWKVRIDAQWEAGRRPARGRLVSLVWRPDGAS